MFNRRAAMSMEKVRIHYIFHGTVQGVGFRYKAAVIRELDEHSWGNIERIESENIPLEGGYGFEIR